MVSIPRGIFGLHLAVGGCAFVVWCGNELGWYGQYPVGVAIVVAVAAVLLVRPHFVLTADGVKFVANVLYVFSIPYASIERERILSVKVAWDRQDHVRSAGGVVYSIRRPFIGVFLECMWNDTGRVATFCLERPRDMDAARRKGEDYARVLGCPLKTR